MIRLSDSLARRRILYPRPIATLPDIMMLDIPDAFAGPSLPLGSYYPIILETEAELRELECYLETRRPAVIVPDLFDRRPSALCAVRITLAHYPRPAPGWPYLLLCHWPRVYTRLVTPAADMFARDSYSMEMVRSSSELNHQTCMLLDTLRAGQDVEVAVVPPSGINASGTA
jgi:hypothetical protein